MAKLVEDSPLQGLRGLLGKDLMFRQVNGETIVSFHRSERRKKSSALQKLNRGKFGKATLYSKAQMRIPERKEYYQKMARELKLPNAYTAAITEYMRKPEIEVVKVERHKVNVPEKAEIVVVESKEGTIGRLIPEVPIDGVNREEELQGCSDVKHRIGDGKGRKGLSEGVKSMRKFVYLILLMFLISCDSSREKLKEDILIKEKDLLKIYSYLQERGQTDFCVDDKINIPKSIKALIEKNGIDCIRINKQKYAFFDKKEALSIKRYILLLTEDSLNFNSYPNAGSEIIRIEEKWYYEEFNFV